MRTLLLLSGGVDSAAVASLYTPDAGLFVDYGQRPAGGERRAAREIAGHFQLRLHEVTVDLSAIGDGLLQHSHAAAHHAPTPEWYPYRNQLLVTVAASRALALGFNTVWIGLTDDDQTRHADGTTVFVGVLRRLLQLQEGGIDLAAPAHHQTSVDLVRDAHLPNSIVERTLSCHVAAIACGQCPGCLKRSVVRSQTRDNFGLGKTDDGAVPFKFEGPLDS